MNINKHNISHLRGFSERKIRCNGGYMVLCNVFLIMIDCIIHIENDYEIWDESVFVECKLPQVPQIGSILHLPIEMERELELKAFHRNTKENYFPKWYYGGNMPEELKDIDNKRHRISFSDAVNVKYVKYEPNNWKVRITLGD